MSVPDTATVLEAIGQRLHDLGLARYSATGVYAGTGLPAVFFGQLPDTPDNAVLINVYNHDTTRDDSSPDVYVQLRYRTGGRDPRTTEQLADTVYTALHDVSNQTWPGGVRVLLCRRVVRAPIQPDANQRYTRPDSYRITLNPTQ